MNVVSASSHKQNANC